MFYSRYLLLAAALLAAASAMRLLKLSEMINNTVCAIKVEIHEDLERIPPRIKMLKCEDKTDQWCEENKIAHHDCCHHAHHKHMMECVEMTDTVLVFNTRTNQTELFEASVGCTCMISSSTTVSSVPGPG